VDLERVINRLGDSWIGYRKALADSLISESSLLTDINTYLINTQGKQLRPLLSLLVASICGEPNEKSYYCAAVSELIHTATLLHDDVADDANYRHGKLTVKVLYSPAASVLTGDYWLAKALHLLSEKCGFNILDCYTHAVRELSVGELIQMEKANSLDTTEKDYYNIIEKKTASLFIAAIKGGALSVDASKDKLDAVTNFALHLGIAFQIKDDIFDYLPNLETGKEHGIDIIERKITLPLLCAFKKSSLEEKEIIIELISQIESKKESSKFILPINKFVDKYQGIADAQAILSSHIQSAINSLDIFPNNNYKESLLDIAKYVGDRNK
jgi:Geranylgeranyl pyrophosphate synthase